MKNPLTSSFYKFSDTKRHRTSSHKRAGGAGESEKGFVDENNMPSLWVHR